MLPAILLDTDMLTDCDDVAALALLHRLADAGLARILAMTVSSRVAESAAVVSAVNTFYGRADLPVGAPKNGRGAFRPDSCFLPAIAREFPHPVADNDSAPDAVEVMRAALENEPDQSVTLVTIGYMTNVADLLDRHPDLVRRKVREWVCMAGNFPVDDASDNVNFTRDTASAVYAVRAFPNRITFVGREIGHNIFVGDSFHTLPSPHPLRRAYELHRGRYGTNWNHHTADPTTILYAVFGAADFYSFQEGTMRLSDDASFAWENEPPSNKRHVVQKMPRPEMAALLDRILLHGWRSDDLR